MIKLSLIVTNKASKGNNNSTQKNLLDLDYISGGVSQDGSLGIEDD